MQISKEVEDHKIWMENNYYRLAGEFISTYSKIENYMLQMYCIYESISTVERLQKMMKNSRTPGRVLLKDRFIPSLGENHDFFKLNSETLKELQTLIDEYRKQRNALGHSHLSDNEVEIAKLNRNKFRLEYIQSDHIKDIIPHDEFFAIYMTREDLIIWNKKIKILADYMNRLRRNVKKLDIDLPDLDAYKSKINAQDV